MAVRSALKLTWASVATIGLALPDVEAGVWWGTAALKIRGKAFACVPTNKQAEKDSVVLMLDFPQRDELIAAEPSVYYLEEHYVNYPCVLVRLNKVHPDALGDLVKMAWTYMNKKAPRRRTVKAKRKSR